MAWPNLQRPLVLWLRSSSLRFFIVDGSLTPRDDEDEVQEPDAKRAERAEPAECTEKVDELVAKRVRSALPKLNITCLPSQSLETAALCRRRETAETVDDYDREVPDIDRAAGIGAIGQARGPSSSPRVS